MSLEDNYMICGETPVWIPNAFDMSSISKCISCTLRLTAQVAGNGYVTTRAEGLLLTEPSTISLAVNGVRHTLVETIVSFPGGHRLPDYQVPCVAELFFYFRSETDTSRYICMALPIDVGKGASNAYFKTLGQTVQSNRPTIATLFTPTATFLSYRGADLRGRSAKDSRPRTFCDPVAQTVTYYVSMTPTRITSSDLDRLQAIATKNKEYSGPPKPTTDAVTRRLLRLGTLVTGIHLDTAAAAAADGGVSTKALKCYRINPEKDIQNEKVYVGGQKRPGGPGDRTLADELERAATDISGAIAAENIENTIQPGDIEYVLGIVIGVAISIVLCATIWYVINYTTFTNYLSAQFYNTPLSAKKLALTFSVPSICPPPTGK